MIKLSGKEFERMSKDFDQNNAALIIYWMMSVPFLNPKECVFGGLFINDVILLLGLDDIFDVIYETPL